MGADQPALVLTPETIWDASGSRHLRGDEREGRVHRLGAAEHREDRRARDGVERNDPREGAGVRAVGGLALVGGRILAVEPGFIVVGGRIHRVEPGIVVVGRRVHRVEPGIVLAGEWGPLA